MIPFPALTSVFDCLRLLIAENVILEGFRAISARSTFQVRFRSISRFGAQTSIFDWLRLGVAENVILERFRAINGTPTFHVTFRSMSRFQA